MSNFAETFFKIARSDPSAYDDPATYDRVVSTIFGRQKIANDISRLFVQYLPTSTNRFPRLLEVACGTGILTMALANKGYGVTAIDLELNPLQELKKKNLARKSILPVSSDMNLNFPITTSSMDGAVMLSANRYIQDKTAFAHEIARVLKPNGLLIWPAGIFGMFLNNFGGKMEPFNSTREIAQTVHLAGLEVICIDSAASIGRNIRTGVPIYSIPAYVVSRRPN